VRDDEPGVIKRAHSEQVPGAPHRSRGEVRTVKGRPGDGQRAGYPGGAVRVVRRPRSQSGHRRPVKAAAVARAGRVQQRLAARRGDRVRVLAAGPDRGQYDAGAALDQVGHRSRRTRDDPQGRVPPQGRHQLSEAAKRGLLTARGEQAQHGHIPAKPVIQRRLGPDGQPGAQPRDDGARQVCLGPGQRPVLADLSQHRGQSANPRVHGVAVVAGAGRRRIARHHRWQPWAVIVADLAKNPRPGRLTKLPVPRASRHPARLQRGIRRPARRGYPRRVAARRSARLTVAGFAVLARGRPRSVLAPDGECARHKGMTAMSDNDPAGSAPPEKEPETSAPAEDPGYLTQTGEVAGDDGSVVPIIGGLPVAEGSAWDIGAPAEDRGAGLAEEQERGGPAEAGDEETAGD
jgi:hypothetical protein